METNIRLLAYGKDLKVFARLYELVGEKLSSKQIQGVCSQIGKRFGVAATPYTLNRKQEVVICSSYFIQESSINVDEWVIQLKQVQKTITLAFEQVEHQQIIADLYKRAFIIAIRKQSEFWTLDSPRIFYEQQPIPVVSDGSQDFDDIDVFRRFEISDVLLGREGLGFAVDISTAFFCNKSVEYYLTNNLKKRFDQLTNRQKEQQGTLLYKGPNGNSKCYFVKFDQTYTLSTAPSLNENGVKYDSPFDYYKKKYPNFNVSPNDSVALVSFMGMDKKVYVPANRLFPRVMNEMLPFYLSNMDKIIPSKRKQDLIEKFWKKVGSKPFGKGFASFRDGFYQAPAEAQGVVKLSAIHFGNNKTLPEPAAFDKESYKGHFKSRRELLIKHGCYYVPPTLEGSKLYFASPSKVPNKTIVKYQEDVTALIRKITKLDIEPIVLPSYDSYLQSTTVLNNEGRPGTAVFVFNDYDPATYSAIDYELKDWKLKRATSYELNKKFDKHEKFLTANHGKGLVDKNWESYIEMTVFDLIQKMGCIPYIIEPARLNYDCQLVIDVSEDFSHYSLSGLFLKKGVKVPILPCQTLRKTDQKEETINQIILKDEIVKLFRGHRDWIKKHNLKSALVLRDGKNCGEEFLAVKNSFSELVTSGILPADFHFDFVEYHKSTRKEIRLWEEKQNDVLNVLEGAYTILEDGKIAIIATTGRATLNQGTSDPLLILNKYTAAPIMKVVEDIFLTSQLNFSSPRVGQRLTLPAKRADEQLIEKRAQEIKRIK